MIPNVIHRYSFDINEVLLALKLKPPADVVGVTVGVTPTEDEIYIDLHFGEVTEPKKKA